MSEEGNLGQDENAQLPDQPDRKDELASIAGQIAHLSTGDRAALRRAYLKRSPAVDGLVVGLLHRAKVPEAMWRGDADFARWRLLAHVAAVISGTAAIVPHARGRRFGRALHAAGYKENRLMRLTAARGPALHDQVVRAARYIAQAGQVPVDLRAVRDLLAEPVKAEAARLGIARDYYSAQYASAGEDR